MFLSGNQKRLVEGEIRRNVGIAEVKVRDPAR